MATIDSQGVALLEVVALCVTGGWTLRFQKLKPGPMALFLMPMDPDIELSATSPAPCLPACSHDSTMTTMGKTSELLAHFS